MKSKETKSRREHYFRDSSGNIQGEFKAWGCSGRLEYHAHYSNGTFHGEYKSWNSDGELSIHTFDINGEEVIDFLKNPDEYPSNSEDKLLFKLKHGTAPFLDEL